MMRNQILLKCAINAGCKSVRDLAKFIRENSNKNKCVKKENIINYKYDKEQHKITNWPYVSLTSA